MNPKQPSYLEKLKKNKTFQINPDEEQFILKAQSGGLNEEQAIQALQVRRQDREAGIIPGQDETQTTNENGEVDINAVEQSGEDPFGGRSKQEVLKLAFKSGITSSKALKEIGDSYDIVMGEGEKTKEQLKQENFSKAEQFIKDNPGASREELKAAMVQYTDLDGTSIDSLLNRDQIKSAKDMLTDEDAQSIAVEIVKEKTGFFTDSEKGKEDALSEIDNDETLNAAEKQKIKDFIEEEYPSGRTLLDKLFPGGK